MGTKFQNKTVIITGASSGIGRATALEFAREKADLFLIARSRPALEEVGRECRSLGGEAILHATDVADESAVKDAINEAVFKYDHIDVLINNAAVTLFGSIEETPYSEYKRVFDINFFGYFNTCRSVIPYMREQGNGTIINVSSTFGEAAAPYTSAYCASKFAVNGFTESLRMELSDVKGIHVATVLLPSVDTPLLEHAANYTGRAVKPLKPIYPPEKMAKVILQAAIRPQPITVVGAASKMAIMGKNYLTPSLAERLMNRKVQKEHFLEEPARPDNGNLFEPMDDTDKMHGGWSQRFPTSKPNGKLITAIAVGAAAAAGTAYMVNNRLRNKIMVKGHLQGKDLPKRERTIRFRIKK
jgi:short-subunit dehydrogenase